MISYDTHVKILNFIAQVKEQLYLPDIAYHYVSTLYQLIYEYENRDVLSGDELKNGFVPAGFDSFICRDDCSCDCAEENSGDMTESDIKIVLYLIILNQTAYSYGDICIRFVNTENGASSSYIKKLVERIYDISVLNSFRYQKKFKKYQFDKYRDKPENSTAAGCDELTEMLFRRFWQDLLDYDSKHAVADYIDLLGRFPKIFSLVKQNDDGDGKFKTPLVCYPCDSSDPCLYFGKNFYYETRVARKIRDEVFHSDHSFDLIRTFYSELKKINGSLPAFNELIHELLDTIFGEQKAFPDNVKNLNATFDNDFLVSCNDSGAAAVLTEIRNNQNYVSWPKVAAATACLSNFTVITGGPGTGKTTTVTKILLLMYALAYARHIDGSHFNVCLAAPTGKAANRMKESIQNSFGDQGIVDIKNRLVKVIEKMKISDDSSEDISLYLNNIPRSSSTIHKLLGIVSSKEMPIYNENNHLPYDLIILDEVSMIDLKLLARLLLAVKPGCKIILLGDHEQLPSVEAGSILADLCHAFRLENGIAGERRKKQFELVNTLVGLTGFESLRLFPFDVSSAVAKLYKSFRFAKAKAIGALASDINSNDLMESGEVYERMLNDTDGRQSVKIIEPENKFPMDKKTEKDYLSKILKQSFPDSIKINFRSSDGNLFNNRVADTVENYSFADYFAEVRELIGYPLDRKAGKIIVNLADENERAKADRLFAVFNQYRVLCTNRGTAFGVENLNREMEDRVLKWYGNDRRLKYLKAQTSTWGEHWYPGRPVMINKNNYHLQLFNGDIGITMFSPGEENQDRPEMKVLFQMSDGSYRYFSTAELSDYELAYAMTVHKSQGSEFDHTVMVLPCYRSTFITRELLYTGITRAKNFVTIYGNYNGYIREYAAMQSSRSSNLVYRLNI